MAPDALTTQLHGQVKHSITILLFLWQDAVC